MLTHNFYYLTTIYINIALMLPNIPELTIAILSAASLGVISVLLNPAYQLTEIEFMLKKTSPKGLMMLDNLKTLQHYDILNKICPELEKSQKGELSSKQLPNLKHVILVRNKLVETKGDRYKGVWFLEELEKYNLPTKALPVVDTDDSFIMMFTVY
jgi:acyl-coenzyme A synthetase/AMP-(fatty) acid ligase